MIKRICICLLKMIPYLVLNAIMFYVIPIYATYIPLRMLILLTATPAMVFILALIYGGKNSINFIYCILATGIFWPAIDMYYKEEGYIYLAIFGILNLTGNIIGRILYKRKKEIKLTFSEKREKKKYDKKIKKEEKEEYKLEKEVNREIKKEKRVKQKNVENNTQRKHTQKSEQKNKKKVVNVNKKENIVTKTNQKDTKKTKNKKNRYKKNEYKKSVKKKKKK